MSSMIIIEKTDQYHDYIYLDENYLENIEQSQYDFCSKTMMNHHSHFSENLGSYEQQNMDVDMSLDKVSFIGDINTDDALMDSCWPMKSQNRHHTSLSPYSTVDNNGMVKWVYEVDYGMESGIAIDNDGVLYFGDHEAYLNAMYLNGTLKWRYMVNEWIWSTPALASDGTVYIGTLGHYLYAINANGTLKWMFWAGRAAAISASPAIATDGTIYFGAMGPNPEPGNECGRIFALYPNGTEKWHYDTGYWINSDVAVADDGTVYIGSGDYYFYAINPDGSLKWRFKTGDIVKSHPAIGMDGTIYFDSFDGYLYALNPDGSLNWKYKGAGCGCAGVAIDEDGIIYAGGDHLTALYPNGIMKWQYTFGGGRNSHHSSPAISADGTIYIGVSTEDSKGGYIFAINHDGTLKWQREIANEECTSSPTIDTQGNVYIGSSSRHSNDGEPYGELLAFGRNDVNQPPEAPVITGTDFGRVNTLYLFNFSVHDPELDDIELFVDWGDGNSTGWLGPYDSDKIISLKYSWSGQGNYQIKAKARDTFDGSESNWSTFNVMMPKIYTFNFLQFLLKLLERFPFFYKIINQYLN